MRLLGLLALLLVIAATPATAQGTGMVHVAGGLTRAYTVTAGSVTDGKLLMQNDGDAAADVRLYQTDYAFFADGRSLYGPAGKLPRSNASWIKLTPSQVTVPAHGTATVFFTITVPADDALHGTYWSVVMVEPLVSGSLDPATPTSAGVQVGVSMVHRYALQMVTTIGEGTAAVEFSNTAVRQVGGKQVLQVDVANTGTVWLRPTAWAELFGPLGTSLGRLEGNKMRLYPGTSGRFTIPLTDIPAGAFDALVVVDDPDGEVFGTQLSLTVP